MITIKLANAQTNELGDARKNKGTNERGNEQANKEVTNERINE